MNGKFRVQTDRTLEMNMVDPPRYLVDYLKGFVIDFL